MTVESKGIEIDVQSEINAEARKEVLKMGKTFFIEALKVATAVLIISLLVIFISGAALVTFGAGMILGIIPWMVYQKVKKDKGSSLTWRKNITGLSPNDSRVKMVRLQNGEYFTVSDINGFDWEHSCTNPVTHYGVDEFIINEES